MGSGDGRTAGGFDIAQFRHQPSLMAQRAADGLGEQGDRGVIEARARALSVLNRSGIPFLVAGAYALFEYTGIYRDTKDLDLMLPRRDLRRSLQVLGAAGFRTEVPDARWLAKAWAGEHFVDLIFASSNGLVPVDGSWFEHAPHAVVLGQRCKLVPAEEMIWSKGYVGGRERYDGADINHLILTCGAQLDWGRLLKRFGNHWELLLSHLVLFGFVYPSERDVVPPWILQELSSRLASQELAPGLPRRCRGNLLSPAAYEHDYERWGFEPEPEERDGSVPVAAPRDRDDELE
jgi:hypothetical protein